MIRRDQLLKQIFVTKSSANVTSLFQTYTLVNYVKQFPRGGINLAELAMQRRNGIAHGSATVLPFLRIRFLSPFMVEVKY